MLQLTATLQRMHISQQVVDLLFRKHVSEAFHLASADSDNFANASVVGRQATQAQIGLFEHAFETGALSAF